MNELESLITNFDEDSKQKILEVYNFLKDKYTNDDIYSEEFALKVVKNIITHRLDSISVIVGLIYPVYKHRNEIINENIFDSEKEIFERLEKIDNLDLSTHQEQLENIKKMFIALAKDIRLIIIKLCIEVTKLDFLDKLNEMEKATYMQQVQDVYFPISQMLGLSQIKNNFGNETFKYYKPQMYEELYNSLSKLVEERNDQINKVIDTLKNELTSICPKVVVYGRQKQMYSIAKKLQGKNMSVSSINDIYGRNNYLLKISEKEEFKENRLKQIMDILAVRILVDTVEECYSALGKVFTLFKPLGNFKDYIANPKDNGYQSLHTAIILDNGDPVEVQIRTFAMHTYAEYGFAAHWAYKEKKKVDESGVKINYIRSIMDLYKDKSSDELLELMKTDVYSGKIFVQSPQGKILSFPEGSTPVDFAYAIHSNVGNTCVGAKINGRIVNLNVEMNNGDTIEIITNANAKGPSRDWLKFVKTSGAKSKINSFFKKEMKEENIKKGKTILETNAKNRSINLSKLMVSEYLDEVFDKYSFQNIDEMYASIGYGAISANQILNKLVNLYKSSNPTIETNKNSISNVNNVGDIAVKGYSNLMTKFAKCCNPLPGDEIIGYISRGKGVTIHRKNCEKLSSCEFERLIECDWKNNSNKNFTSSITIYSTEGSNVIAKLTKKINDEKIQLTGLNIKENSQEMTIITIQVVVKDKNELEYLINKLKQISFVKDISRTI